MVRDTSGGFVISQVFCSSAKLRRGLYRWRPDRGYSLTDCISMQTMPREGLTGFLTNNRHLEQEGFRVPLRIPEMEPWEPIAGGTSRIQT
jgi:hypothetical protein